MSWEWGLLMLSARRRARYRRAPHTPDKEYQSIKEKAKKVDAVLEKESPTTKELKQAGKDTQEINQYVQEHQSEENTQQIQGLKTTQNNYNEQATAKLEEAKNREEVQAYRRFCLGDWAVASAISARPP